MRSVVRTNSARTRRRAEEHWFSLIAEGDPRCCVRFLPPPPLRVPDRLAHWSLRNLLQPAVSAAFLFPLSRDHVYAFFESAHNVSSSRHSTNLREYFVIVGRQPLCTLLLLHESARPSRVMVRSDPIVPRSRSAQSEPKLIPQTPPEARVRIPIFPPAHLF